MVDGCTIIPHTCIETYSKKHLISRHTLAYMVEYQSKYKCQFEEAQVHFTKRDTPPIIPYTKRLVTIQSARSLPPLEFHCLSLPRLRQKARNRTVEANKTHLQGIEHLSTSNFCLATGEPVLSGKDSKPLLPIAECSRVLFTLPTLF